MFVTVALAALAGSLSILSPCVLPLVPIVVGTAATRHRFGSAALAAGLALSFTAIGLFVATVGFALGVDGGAIRLVGAAAMVAIGVVLLLPALQGRLTGVLGPLGVGLERGLAWTGVGGSTGSFGVGLLLGAVWSPCVGPTLGAASLLAARGKDLGSVALTMAAFGLGAALPLLAIGLVSRARSSRRRAGLLATGLFGKRALGAALGLVGVLILTGLDRRLETWLVDVSPTWLTTTAVAF